MQADTFETSIDVDDDEAGPGGVRITVPGGELTGLWQDPDSPPGVAKLDFLTVTDEGKGKGTYLAGVFAREAIAHGATALHSDIISRQAMRNRVRIFGGHNLTYVERRPDGTEWVLPMTPEQAVMSIERAEKQADDWDNAGQEWPNDFSPGVGTRVNLMSPSVRIRLGLPPIASGLERPESKDGVPQTGAGSPASGSVESVRAEIGDNVELVRQIGDLVLGSSATLRSALQRLQETITGAQADSETAGQLQAALEQAGISVEHLNAAIEQLRRYDRDIGSL